MLKFSGFAGLTSCLGRSPRRTMDGRVTLTDATTKASEDALQVVHSKESPYIECVRGRSCALTHRYAQVANPRKEDLATGIRWSRH